MESRQAYVPRRHDAASRSALCVGIICRRCLDTLLPIASSCHRLDHNFLKILTPSPSLVDAPLSLLQVWGILFFSLKSPEVSYWAICEGKVFKLRVSSPLPTLRAKSVLQAI